MKLTPELAHLIYQKDNIIDARLVFKFKRRQHTKAKEYKKCHQD